MSARHRALALALLASFLVSGCGAVVPTGTFVPATATGIALGQTSTSSPPSATPPPLKPTVVRPTPIGTPLQPSTVTAAPPTVTPATTFLAEDDAGGKVAFYSARDGNTEIYIMNVDGSNLERLTNNASDDVAPAISPDGTQVAFMSTRDGNSEIYVMNIDGTDQQRLTNTPAYESHPNWSADGTQIAFVSERDGNREIYIMNADGSNVQRLTNDPADDIRPDWSPDGAKILFNSERDGNFEIYVMDVDGSNLYRLTDNPKWEMFPQWSPDGTQIAYTFHTPRQWDQEIFVMNADGTGVRQLTDSSAASENPVWSPDGSQIAFQSDRDGNFEIYVMSADGVEQYSGGQRRLTNNPAGDYWPSWGRSQTPVPAPATETATYVDPTLAGAAGLDHVIVHTQVCGFLIITGGKRVLIDSLFRVENPPTPAERVLAMRQGRSPFDDIDLILVTHDHYDHFNAELVGDNMLNNPRAVFVSTNVVVNRLRSQFSRFAQIQDRVIGVHLEQGEREQMNVAGIDLEIFALSHGVATVPNLGYFFAIDDISFFHTGDMNPEYVAVADLQAYDLPERQIDIAFVSAFRLADERYSDRILIGIQPKVMVPMHVNFSKEYDVSVLDEVESNFQNIILFRQEMAWQTFDLGRLR